MNFFKKFKPLILLISVFVVCYSIVYFVFAYSEPLHSPPTCLTGEPGCDPPINTGATSQTKAGPFTVGLVGGIGELTVNGTSYFANTNIYGTLTITNPNNLCLGGVCKNAWDQGYWQDGGAGKIYYNSGNVGIGVTTPTAKLDVQGAGNSRAVYGHVLWGPISGTAENYAGYFSAAGGPGSGAHLTNYAGYFTASGGDIANWAIYAAAGNAYFNGNVGIGTAIPKAKLDVQGPLRQDTLTRHPVGTLVASALQAKSYEIARIGYDQVNWSANTSVFVELYQNYWDAGGYKKYEVRAGYADDGSYRLIEATGPAQVMRYGRLRIGSPVLKSGTLYYLPVYVDVDYYTQWRVVVSHNMTETVSDAAETANIKIYENPAGFNVASFTETDLVTNEYDNYFAGTVKIAGGSPGIGKVLTSDVNGLATWQTLGAGGGVIGGFGTQNYVSKFNNAGGTTIGNSAIYSSDTNNVGISNSNPERKLHVSGGNILTDNTYTLEAKNSAGIVETWMWPRYSDNIMYTNYGVSGWNIRNNSSVSTMFMDNSGDVGIGTIAPNAALQIVRDATGGELLRLSGYSLMPDAFYLKVFPVVGSNTVDYRFQTVDNTGGTKDMLYLDSSTGNVGIGTATPTAKLEVAGTAKMTGFQLGTSATAGQVLTTDASGVGTWQTAATGVGGSGTANYLSKFTAGTTLGNSQIFDNGTNVGIGTASPSAGLHVSSPASILRLQDNNSVGVAAVNYIDFYDSTVRQGYIGYGSASDSNMYFTNDTGANWIFSGSGNVGIGATAPSYKLDVNGDIRSSGFFYSTESATDKFGNVNTSGWGVDALNNGSWDLLVYNGSNLYFNQAYFGYGGAATIRTYDTNENLAIMPNGTGNVGIGTATPGAKLEVAGTAKMTGFQLGTSATAGQVLTTDASGVGTWQTAATGVGGSGTANYLSKFTAGTTLGNSQIFDNGTNVGIGTATPGANKLEVSGGQLKADNDLTVSGTSYLANVNVYGTVNLLADAWITGASRAIARDSYFGYSSGYRATQFGADLSVRDIAIGVDPTSVTGGAFTGTGEIALPNLVEFMQKNSGGTDWLQNVLALNNGNVGIGTTNPTAKLEVAGTAKMTGFQLGASATAGQVLTTDASGVGTWQAAATGVGGSGTVNYLSKFTAGTTLGNSQIFDNGTNVGIGTASPTSKLEVTGGQIKANGDLTVVGTSYLANVRSYGDVIVDGNVGIGTATPGAKLNVVGGDIKLDTSTRKIYVAGNSTNMVELYNGSTGALTLSSGNATYNYPLIFNQGGATVMTIKTGNVGIGTASPSTLLSLGGSLGMKLAVYDGGTAASSYGFGIQSGRMFAQNSAGNEVMVWTSGGNVGIGTTAPGAKLEVAGQVKITGGTPGDGKVLTSDATGLATWQTPAATGVGGSGTANYLSKFTAGSTLGNSQIFDNGTNVGIGTASPSQKLEVDGTSPRILLKGTASAFMEIDGAAANQAGLMFDNAGANAWQFGRNSDNSIYFYDYAGVAGIRMMIQPGTGNVGIGTASPVAKLVVGNLSNWGTSPYLDAGFKLTSPYGVVFQRSSDDSVLSINVGATAATLSTSYHSSGAYLPIHITPGNNQPLVLQASGTGNVGIGTTNPGVNKLEVVGGPIKATGGLIMETRSNGTNPTNPAVGQIWMCTDSGYDCQ